ncbi:hypothetical protein AN958_12260 [Leucoagaricus sp. SymC.cos]|nr:hypothetical protein AN958_12260 [Leucoagaricus sp. SymC.cos]
MTSNGHLTSQRSPNRVTQHQQRLGSRSPNSIPSSPTSVHSSSSAIFERDIEPIVPPSPPFPQNPHRIPRAKGTEQLEHSVPSVLDSAASILATIDDSNEPNIAIVAPASTSPVGFESILARSPNSGFTSPIGSFRSRSPSPLGLRVATGPGVAASIPLLNIPPISTSQTQAVPVPGVPAAASSPSHSAASSSPPLSTRQITNGVPNAVSVNPPPPAIVTPTSASEQFVMDSVASTESDESSSPTTETACEHPTTNVQPTAESGPHQSVSSTMPIPTPTSASVSGPTSIQQQQPHQPPQPMMSSPHTSAVATTLSHPPSPTHGPTKRLSFMSYSDLLSSTPASTLPLSSLTSSASSMEPPPHIPSVSGLALANAAQAHHGGGQGHTSSSTATSLRGFAMGGITHTGKRDSIVMLDDVGGEWEREGLGRGLEERLEALINTPSPQLPPHIPQQVVVPRT